MRLDAGLQDIVVGNKLCIVKSLCLVEFCLAEPVNLRGKYLCLFTDQNIKVFAPYIIEYFQLLNGSILLRQGNLATSDGSCKPSLLTPDKFLIHKKPLLSDAAAISEVFTLITGDRIGSH